MLESPLLLVQLFWPWNPLRCAMLFISKSLSRGLRSKTFTYIKARNQLTTNVFHNLNRYVSLSYNKIQIRKPFWRPKKWLSCASSMPFSSSLTVIAITRTESGLWMVPSYKQISELSDSESFQRLHNNANCALHNHYNACYNPMQNFNMHIEQCIILHSIFD